MHQKSALTFALSLSALALVGCEEETACPTPTAATDAPAEVVPAATATPAATPKVAPTVRKTTPTADRSAADTEVRSRAAAPVTDDDARCADADGCAADADLYVKRLVIARKVKNREPVEAAATFALSEGKRVYAFVEVGNRDHVPGEVTVSFRRIDGKERGEIPLRVGASPRWRTWAYTDLATKVGEWEAVVRDGQGDVIGRKSFHVTELPTSFDPYAESEEEKAQSKTPAKAASSSLSTSV